MLLLYDAQIGKNCHLLFVFAVWFDPSVRHDPWETGRTLTDICPFHVCWWCDVRWSCRCVMLVYYDCRWLLYEDFSCILWLLSVFAFLHCISIPMLNTVRVVQGCFCLLHFPVLSCIFDCCVLLIFGSKNTRTWKWFPPNHAVVLFNCGVASNIPDFVNC